MTLFELNHEKLSQLKVPAYIFSKAALSHQVQSLRAALPKEIKFLYSFKANSQERVISLLHAEGAGADVASRDELRAALDVGFPSRDIEFTGPGKSREALLLAIQSRVASIVVESVDELLLINQLGEELQTQACISVRVNPDLYFSAAGKAQRRAGSQFGIDEEQLAEFFVIQKKCQYVKLVGVHIFSQSQILDQDILLQNFSAAMDTAIRASRWSSEPLAKVNLGGGFGVPYYQGQDSLCLDRLQSGLSEILERGRGEDFLRQAQFYVESGRYLAGPAGIYVAQVLYKKKSRGKNIVILSGGFSHNMAVCGFGQLIRKNYKVHTIQHRVEEKKELVTLVGPSCYSLDNLANDIELPRLSIGDYVCFENCGSYGASFSPGKFLSFESASEYFVEDL